MAVYKDQREFEAILSKLWGKIFDTPAIVRSVFGVNLIARFRMVVVLCVGLLAAASGMAAVNITVPSSPGKIVSIHHSSGGNWLADPNNDQPYGGLAAVLAGGGDASADTGVSGSRLATADFTYKGAFRLPDTSDDGWQYGGGALTWYPDGDADGPADGYPGSLFGAGHNVNNRISEISIPVPVVSAAKNLSDLNFAATLQGFTDLKGSLAAVLDTPPQYAGIAYLPAQGDQAGGKLYLTFGQHFQEFDASLLWCDPDLSTPDIAGPWLFGGYPNYVTNDYLFAIPETFATTYLFGKRLASGRHREGVWGGLGPTLFASAPWADGNPPIPGTSLSTPLHFSRCFVIAAAASWASEMSMISLWRVTGFTAQAARRQREKGIQWVRRDLARRPFMAGSFVSPILPSGRREKGDARREA